MMDWDVCQASRVSFLTIAAYTVLPFLHHNLSDNAICPVPKVRRAEADNIDHIRI
jgi:hypothetical protein